MRPRTMLAPLLIAGSLLGMTGCQDESGGDVTTDSTAPSVPAGEVLVKSVAFNPRELRAKVGEQVTWRFDDGGLEHTVTADDDTFDSGRVSTGTFQRTFSAPGTINYHCNVHARMRGTVLVS